MKRVITLLAFLCPAAAVAQPSSTMIGGYNTGGCGTVTYDNATGKAIPVTVDNQGNLCVNFPSGGTTTALVGIVPPPLTGFGTLSVLAASIALSGATVGPNSAVWPASTLPNRALTVKNSVASASNLYVCPKGGTCATTTGIPLAPGESQTWNLGTQNVTTTSPTVISGGTATAVVSW